MFGDPLDKQFPQSLLDAARKVNDKTTADAKTAKEDKERLAAEDDSLIGQFDERWKPTPPSYTPFHQTKTGAAMLKAVEELGARQKAAREAAEKDPDHFKKKIAAAKAAKEKPAKTDESVTLASLAMIGGSVGAGAYLGGLVNRIRKGMNKPKPLGAEYAGEKERYYKMGASAAKAGKPAKPPSTAHPELKAHYHAGHEENS